MSLNQALNKIDTFNVLQYLRQDAEAGDIIALEFDRVLEPRFPQLMSNINEFNELASAILSQQLLDQWKSGYGPFDNQRFLIEGVVCLNTIEFRTNCPAIGRPIDSFTFTSNGLIQLLQKIFDRYENALTR